MKTNIENKKQYPIEDFYVGVVIQDLSTPSSEFGGAVVHSIVEFWDKYWKSRLKAVLMLFRKSSNLQNENYLNYYSLHTGKTYRKFDFDDRKCFGLYDEPVQLLKFLPKVDFEMPKSITDGESKVIFSRLFEVRKYPHQYDQLEEPISEYVAHDLTKNRIFKKEPAQSKFYLGEKQNIKNLYFGDLSLETRRLIREGQTGSDMCLNVPENKMLIVHGAIRENSSGYRQSYNHICAQNTNKDYFCDKVFYEQYTTLFLKCARGMLNLHNNQIYLPNGNDHYCESSLKPFDDSDEDMSVPEALAYFSRRKLPQYIQYERKLRRY